MASELIAEGYYNAVATPVTTEDGSEVIAQWGFAKPKERGKKGTKQVMIYFEIIDGPHAGERYPWFGYFGQNSYARTLQSLRYSGWKGDDLGDINNQPMDQLVSICIEHNEWTNDEGEVQVAARVAWVNRAGGGTIKMRDPMSQRDLIHFAAQMKAYLSEAPEEDGKRIERGARNDGGNGARSNAPEGNADENWHNDFGAGDEPPPPADDDIPF